MKPILKVLKYMLLTVLGLVILFTLAITIFLYTSPQFGKIPTGAHLEKIKQSENFKGGVFQNLIETKMGSFGEMMGTVPDALFGKNGSPIDSLPVKFGEEKTKNIDSLYYITWYGHSAFLLEMDEKRILLDPMLGKSAAPVSFGAGRFPYQKPIPFEDLRDIDAVVLSHDHYDHLDYPTIKQIKDEVGVFFTALGLGSHLKSWGVEEDRIVELDWWETAKLDDITFTACPARHFSGRGFADRNKTQWASWSIVGSSRIYFSGDGGYGPHFKDIGDRLGPFDFAMMECGQYNKAWEAIHMMPEQSVQAGIDVKSDLLMPIHWGGFKLAVHTWTDPIVRFKEEADRLGINVLHPYIGERLNPNKTSRQESWWEDIN